MLYLDFAASTPISSRALNVLQRTMLEDFANPSAAHKLGKNLLKRIEEARSEFLNILNAPKGFEFIFTGSATESNNMIIRGLSLCSDDEILYSEADHPSVVNPCKSWSEKNIKVHSYLLDKQGSILIDKLIEQVNDKTKLVVLSQVNNQSGNHHDINNIAKLIKAKNSKTVVHVDGVQGFAKVETDLSDGNIDSYVISAHKITGPKGISGVSLNKSLKLTPLLIGGGHEEGRRSSTLAAPLIFSFLEATRFLNQDRVKHFEEMLNQQKVLREKIAPLHNNISFPFPLEVISPYILTFMFKGLSSDILLRHLEAKDVYIASSSACSSRAKGKSSVFEALNIDEKNHKFMLRVSFGVNTTNEDINHFVEILEEVIKDLSMFIK
jgi:cysteine desulfurase